MVRGLTFVGTTSITASTITSAGTTTLTTSTITAARATTLTSTTITATIAATFSATSLSTANASFQRVLGARSSVLGENAGAEHRHSTQ